MRKYLPFLLSLLLVACTEKVDLQSVSDYHDYLVVDAVLTDNPNQPQCVNLSRTVSYFEEEEPPRVQNARVSVNDLVFKESEPGVYQAPEGYACRRGEMMLIWFTASSYIFWAFLAESRSRAVNV